MWPKLKGAERVKRWNAWIGGLEWVEQGFSPAFKAGKHTGFSR